MSLLARLQSLGLEKYHARLLAEGYDEWGFVRDLHHRELEDCTEECGFSQDDAMIFTQYVCAGRG